MKQIKSIIAAMIVLTLAVACNNAQQAKEAAEAAAKATADSLAKVATADSIAKAAAAAAAADTTKKVDTVKVKAK